MHNDEEADASAPPSPSPPSRRRAPPAAKSDAKEDHEEDGVASIDDTVSALPARNGPGGWADTGRDSRGSGNRASVEHPRRTPQTRSRLVSLSGAESSGQPVHSGQLSQSKMSLHWAESARDVADSEGGGLQRQSRVTQDDVDAGVPGDAEYEDSDEDDDDDSFDERAAGFGRGTNGGGGGGSGVRPSVAASQTSASKEQGGKSKLDLGQRKSVQATAVMEEGTHDDASRKKSQVGSSRAGSEMNSLHRTISSDTHLKRLSVMVTQFKTWCLNTRLFHLYVRLSESVAVQVALWEFLLLSVTVCIAVLSQKIVLSENLPSISFYNLVNAVLGLLGKIAIYLGYTLMQVIAKGETASLLVKATRGLSITSVVHHYGIHNPVRGRTLRRVFMGSLVSVEISLWVLGYCMKWKSVASEIGYYSCTMAYYSTAPSLYTDIGNYLSGDMEFAEVYNYGLTLGDGVVGGWSSWPGETPASTFSVSGSGVLYATGVNCDEATVANETYGDGLTYFNILFEESWNMTYNMAIEVRLPGGSHDMSAYANNDILQRCDIALMFGSGNLTFFYDTDEWGAITGGQVTDLSPGDGSSGVYLTQRMETESYFSQLALALNESSYTRTNFTDWTAQHLHLLFSNTSFGSSQGATFCNLLQWGTLPDGLYHTNVIYRGVAAIVASTAHYVLMQYDTGDSSLCLFSAEVGAGIISVPQWTTQVVIAVLSLNLFLQLVLILSWLVATLGTTSADRAAALLDDPLRLLYYMRESLPRLTRGVRPAEDRPAAVRQEMERVVVRFGEMRATRGETVGQVALDAPQMVLRLRRGRQYE
ncbi:hypothetical protein HK405_002540 [Cladochytrium tenue]|nr:hypothetical protein HK405_002540 [Cladochytrium tenue]